MTSREPINRNLNQQSSPAAHRLRWISAALMVAVLWGCEAAEQEQEILSVVSDAASMIEDQSVSQIFRLTTRDFIVQPGRIGKSVASRRLLSFLRANGRIVILHPTPVVEVRESGKSALVSAPFVIARRGADVRSLKALEDDEESWVAEASRNTTVQRAEISLVKKDDRWLIRTFWLLDN